MQVLTEENKNILNRLAAVEGISSSSPTPSTAHPAIVPGTEGSVVDAAHPAIVPGTEESVVDAAHPAEAPVGIMTPPKEVQKVKEYSVTKEVTRMPYDPRIFSEFELSCPFGETLLSGTASCGNDANVGQSEKSANSYIASCIAASPNVLKVPLTITIKCLQQ